MPLTGLGLFKGFRGNGWLKNRIRIIKQFVVPSLLNQTNKNFTLWISVRPEERSNQHIRELKNYFDAIKDFKTVFTYNGLCFWDDKLSDINAYAKLITNLH